MVNNTAITYIVKKISDINGAPCKKTLQKMVFLIEKKNIDLGCRYGIHFYGPYSADLDFAVRELCDEGVLEIQYTPLEHRITVSDEAKKNEYHNDMIDEIIAEFAKDTASELELLATALYVYQTDNNKSEVLPRVIKIKGTKYSNQRINNAIQRLEHTGYIA